MFFCLCFLLWLLLQLLLLAIFPGSFSQDWRRTACEGSEALFRAFFVPALEALFAEDDEATSEAYEDGDLVQVDRFEKIFRQKDSAVVVEGEPSCCCDDLCHETIFVVREHGGRRLYRCADAVEVRRAERLQAMPAWRRKGVDGFLVQSFLDFAISPAVLAAVCWGRLCFAVVLVVLEERLAELGGERDAPFRIETIPISAAEGTQERHGRQARADERKRRKWRKGRNPLCCTSHHFMGMYPPYARKKTKKTKSSTLLSIPSLFSFGAMKSPLFAIILLLLSALALFWTFFPPPLP